MNPSSVDRSNYIMNNLATLKQTLSNSGSKASRNDSRKREYESHHYPQNEKRAKMVPIKATKEDLKQASHGISRSKTATADTSKRSKFKTFPERLQEIIKIPGLEKAIYWLPNGITFCIHPVAFGELVLQVYFQGAKFESFTRKLNRWGFKRVFDDTYSPEGFVYRHEKFQKDKPELLAELAGSGNKKAANSRRSKQGPTITNDSPATITPTAAMNRSVLGNAVANLNLGGTATTMTSTPVLGMIGQSLPQPVISPMSRQLLLQIRQQRLQEYQQMLESQMQARSLQASLTLCNPSLALLQAQQFTHPLSTTPEQGATQEIIRTQNYLDERLLLLQQLRNSQGFLGN